MQKAYQHENIEQIKTQKTLQESTYFSFADFLNGWYFRLVKNVLSNHNSTDFFSTAIIVNFILVVNYFFLMINAEPIIKRLRLVSHPEGGYFRENYRSNQKIDSKFLPKKFRGARNISTSIDLPEINCGDQL